MMDDIDCTSALDVFATGVTGFNDVLICKFKFQPLNNKCELFDN